MHIRKQARSLLHYVLPAVAAATSGVVIEYNEYEHAQATVAANATQDSIAYATLIAGRLNTRFTELEIASAVLGGAEGGPATPSPMVEQSLQNYLAANAHNYTFNILSADGEHIQWSTTPLSHATPSAMRDFAPVEKSSRYLLGPVHYVQSMDAIVLPLRVHGVSNTQTGYFLASPYKISRLLDTQELPREYRNWVFTVMDTRTNAPLQALPPSDKHTGHTTPDNTRLVTTPVIGYPFTVQVRITPHNIWTTFRKQAVNRWGSEGLVLTLLFVGIGFMIRRQEKKQNRQQQRLTDFNAFLAQISYCISQAQEESRLLQDICDLAIRYAHLDLAFIARPDASQQFQFLAVGGQHAITDTLFISARADLPEGQGSVGRVWRSAQAIFNASFVQNAHLAPWKNWAEQHNLHANAALPIMRDGKIWAVLSVYHRQPDIFDHQLQALLQEVATDISRGLEKLYNKKLQSALLYNSVVGILLVKDHIIQLTNSRVEHMLGLPAEALVNQPAELLFTDPTEFARAIAVNETLQHKHETRIPNVRLARKDGHLLLADLSGVRLHDLSGDVSVWTIEDVTTHEVARRLYHALLNTADAVLQATDEAEMCDRTCADLVLDTLFHAVWIGRIDSRGHLEVLSRAGEGTDSIHELSAYMKTGSSPVPVMLRAWNTRTLVYSNDELADMAKAPYYAFIEKSRWRAVLSAPIWRAGKVWAIISFAAAQTQVFDAQSITLCQRVADLLGHALDKLDAQNRIESLQEKEAQRARHDPLTGLPNRLALEECMPLALTRAREQGRGAGICMLDLDDFKQVNDTYGHEAGDHLLQQLAQRLVQSLRPTDFVARLGGDEFVVVLEELDALLPIAQATTVLNTLHTAVETPFQVTPEATASVGMTLGMALYPLDGEDPDTLLRRADAAMYLSKQTKATRTTWWRLASALPAHPSAEEVQVHTFDAYGPEARDLLTRAKTFLLHIQQDFVEQFHDNVRDRAEWQKLFSSMTESERTELRHADMEHLQLLLAPETQEADILKAANPLGASRALSGVDPVMLTEIYSTYRRQLIDSMDKAMLRAYDRYHILLTTEIRLQEDKATQLAIGQKIEQQYFAQLSAPMPDLSSTWPDACAQAINALGQLTGIQAVILYRKDADGKPLIEASAGPLAQDFVQILQTSFAQPPTQDTLDCSSITAQAWMSAQITSTPSYALDPRTPKWRDTALQLGFRSALSIPLREEGGQVSAVLTLLGGYPNQFESLMMRQFAHGLQQRWEQISQRYHRQPAPSVTQERSQHLRSLLFAGGLRMFVQPVIDLQSGVLLEVEALARIEDTDGQIISPAMFLPLLGRNELDQLFYKGLEQALTSLSQWDKDGLHTNLAINLPSTFLLNNDGPQKIADMLAQYHIEPHRLAVELLETHSLDYKTQASTIRQFKERGIQLAIDDLGSGHSSLLRLSSLPFDIIKVDQALLRHLHDMPLQILSVVKSILDMGKDFHSRVVVEGLSDQEVMDAVSHLGHCYGQGYGIARPMPAADLPGWYKEHQATYQQKTVQADINSDLAALACHWITLRNQTAAGSTVPDQDPMIRWFATQNLQNSDAARWHQQSCQTPPVPGAAAKLTAWLLERLRKNPAS